jgi:hypothetical protein
MLRTALQNGRELQELINQAGARLCQSAQTPVFASAEPKVDIYSNGHSERRNLPYPLHNITHTDTVDTHH